VARQAIRADGLGDTIRAFKLFAPELLPVAQGKLLQVAEIAARAAVRRLPKGNSTREVTDRSGTKRRRPVVRTGEAANSVTVKKSGKANVVIQGGTARGEGQYFGWLDFGGTIKPNPKQTIKRRVVKGGRYIYPAAADNADRMTDAMESALDTITRKLDLD
jgi:hypothetical protein